MVFSVDKVYGPFYLIQRSLLGQIWKVEIALDFMSDHNLSSGKPQIPEGYQSLKPLSRDTWFRLTG